MYTAIPMQAISNHKFSCKVYVDSNNILLKFRMSYNEIAKYWVVDLYKDDTIIYAGLPLIPGQNILEQVAYLGIGSAWIIPRSDVEEQWPTYDTLTSDWYVIWGDTGG